MQVQRKTIFERIIHAIGFEVIAVAICAPVGAWLLDRSVLQMGTLAILLSSVAMLWNIIYNSLFDYFWPVSRVAKTLRVRAFHALGFESGFILIGLPIAAGVLGGFSVTGAYVGDRFLPVLPALHHVLQLGL